MATQILRPLLAAMLVFSTHIVAFSADGGQKEEYEPGKYESLRRARSLIAADEELIDSILKTTIEILGYKDRRQQIIDAASFLQDLVTIHASHRLGTETRKQKLTDLWKMAKQRRFKYQKIRKCPPRFDRDFLINGLDVSDSVKRYVKDYFKEIYEYQRIMFRASATICAGGSVGCGTAILTFLSGARYLAFCPSIGVTRGGGAEVTLESCRGTSASYFTASEQYHIAEIFSSGTIRDLRTREQDAERSEYIFENNPNNRSIGVGFGCISILSGEANLPLLPLPSSLHFAKQYLGIGYLELVS